MSPIVGGVHGERGGRVVVVEWRPRGAKEGLAGSARHTVPLYTPPRRQGKKDEGKKRPELLPPLPARHDLLLAVVLYTRGANQSSLRPSARPPLFWTCVCETFAALSLTGHRWRCPLPARRVAARSSLLILIEDPVWAPLSRSCWGPAAPAGARTAMGAGWTGLDWAGGRTLLLLPAGGRLGDRGVPFPALSEH